MGEWQEVDREYRFIHRCIAGAMNLLARYINFSGMSANGARVLPHLALPHGRVSICQKDNQ